MLAFIGSYIRNRFTFFPDNFTGKDPVNFPHYVTRKRIRTKDGEELEALLYKHDKLNSENTLTIYFHGNAGNLYDRINWVERIFNMRQDVLLVSYRGYSKSTGKPSEKGIYKDGEAAIQYAINTLGYDEKDVTLFGRSLGSTVAIHVSQYLSLHGVIVITPLTSGKEMAVAMGKSHLKIFAGQSFNSIQKIENITSKLLIIHGDRDQVIPVAMGKAIFKKYSGPKKMVVIKNGTHNNLQDISPDQFWRSIFLFYHSSAENRKLSVNE